MSLGATWARVIKCCLLNGILSTLWCPKNFKREPSGCCWGRFWRPICSIWATLGTQGAQIGALCDYLGGPKWYFGACWEPFWPDADLVTFFCSFWKSCWGILAAILAHFRLQNAPTTDENAYPGSKWKTQCFSTACSCDLDASEVRKCVFSIVNTYVFSMSAFPDKSPNAFDNVLF